MKEFAFALVLAGASLGCAREAKPTAEPQGAAQQPAAQATAEPAAVAEPDAGPDGDTQEEFASFVATRNTCAADAECVLVSPGCPLGCGTGVRPEHAEEVSAKARALIAQAEAEHGGGCTYKCAYLVPKCAEGRCAAVQE